MKEGEGRIEIKDFPHEVIEACLRFMYSGRLSVQRRLLVEVAAFRHKCAYKIIQIACLLSTEVL